VILLLVPVFCAVAGVAVYGVLRLTGVLDFASLGTTPQVREPGWRPWRSEATTFRDRIEEIPRGVLLGVIIAAGAWILGWVVVLIVGLSLLA
jgi:amino acid transporter